MSTVLLYTSKERRGQLASITKYGKGGFGKRLGSRAAVPCQERTAPTNRCRSRVVAPAEAAAVWSHAHGQRNASLAGNFIHSQQFLRLIAHGSLKTARLHANTAVGSWASIQHRQYPTRGSWWALPACEPAAIWEHERAVEGWAPNALNIRGCAN